MDAPNISIFNSTELRLINARVTLVGGPVLNELPTRRRSTRRRQVSATADLSREEQVAAEEQRSYALDPESESTALSEIRSIGG